MSSMRIVLVDPLGDVLFSGESVIARERGAEALPETLATPIATSIATPIAASIAAIASAPDSSEALTEPEGEEEDELESEPCPETMRSAGSGVYRAVDRTARLSRLRNVG